MDLNLLSNRGPTEDLSGSSLSTDRSIAILYQMIEQDDGIPTQWLNSSVLCESGIVERDLQGQKPTTDEQDKLTQLSLGNFAGNTSQPLPRHPDHEETYNHEVLPSPPCKRVELSSSEGKGRTYKKFSFEEMEKLIDGVEKYGGKYCNWKTIKNLYFKDSDRSKDQLKQKWKDLMKHATKKTDGEQRLFYMMAAIVEVRIQPDKQNVFEKVIQEWYVTSEIGLRLARDWLNSGQKPTTDEQDKLTQLSLGNFAGNTSQPLPSFDDHLNWSITCCKLPDHKETYNQEVPPSPLCKRAELSSSKRKGGTYKKFNFEEMEKLIEGVEKYGRKYCNWKTIKKLYFEDSNQSKDQLKCNAISHLTEYQTLRSYSLHFFLSPLVFKHMDSYSSMDIEEMFEILATLEHEGITLSETLTSLGLGDRRPSLEDTNSQLPSPGASDASPTAAQNQSAQPSHLSLGNNGFTCQPLQSNYSQTARDGTSNFPLINGRNYVGPNHHVAPSSGPPQCKTIKKSHKSYSVEEEENLVRQVAIHGQKWKSIAKSFPERSEEQLKQKWKDVMKKAGTKMDKNKKWLHIFAAVVHVNIKKTSKYKQKFQKWFQEMEREDREIKAYAEAWFRKVKDAPSSPLQN
ncbi:hypothetical protein LOK49_LG05G01291 [Camellia lanceoleosa]|uniref:Uncharacterized protein n=1 Tax=Camellia lanceoleosa TaxID=1840588 RepID=A0ACC0HRM3_9ERIC|nr:hypothetical protein LOK49_LG05G01291 [Camellia lanceoleosa]